MLNTTIGKFRLIAFLEGISYILLLFVAMPIKYFLGDPSWVKVMGMAHGVLFILFVLLLALAAKQERWLLSFNIYAFITSLIPFGTFHLDKKLKEHHLIKSKSIS